MHCIMKGSMFVLILEVGPGKALSGFVKKTLGADVHCTAVETAEELEAFLTSWKEAQA